MIVSAGEERDKLRLTRLLRMWWEWEGCWLFGLLWLFMNIQTIFYSSSLLQFVKMRERVWRWRGKVNKEYINAYCNLGCLNVEELWVCWLLMLVHSLFYWARGVWGEWDSPDAPSFSQFPAFLVQSVCWELGNRKPGAGRSTELSSVEFIIHSETEKSHVRKIRDVRELFFF